MDDHRPQHPVVTEAQLRWAQFHKASKSQQVRQGIEKLHQQPDDISDVSSCAFVEGLSKGRCKLLKQSQRAYESRRAQGLKSWYNDEDEDDDEWMRMFASEPNKRRKRRRRRRNQNHQSQFESAFRAMMQALAAAQVTEEAIEVPTKRWTRQGPTIETLWWTPRILRGQRKASLVHPDRGAPWMFRGRQQDGDDETMQEDRGALPLTPQRPPRRSLLADKRRLFESSPLHQDDAPGAPHIALPLDAVGFVRGLVQRLEEQAPEELVHADGKLHKPNFAKMVKDYLGATPKAQNKSKSQFRSSTAFVQQFIEQIETMDEEDDQDDRQSLVTDEGKLDKAALEQIVTRYLAKAATQTLEERSPPEEKKEEEPGMTMTQRVKGGIARLFGGKGDNDDNDGNNSLEDRQAVERFRNHVRKDDESSLSSFRALPAGLANIVKSLRGKDVVEEKEGNNMYDRQVGGQSFESMSSMESSHHPAMKDYAPDRLKEFHDKVMERFQGQAVIDTDGSEVSMDADMAQGALDSLLLSPTVLTQRHQQAIRAIKGHKWEQVTYLISANPWLAEMTDVQTGQYLLHNLALFGIKDVVKSSRTGEILHRDPSPEQTNIDLIRMFAPAVHKYDQDGNLPMHMAAASGNLVMLTLLGDRFPSGASVRNEDGMLPLHLAVMACGSSRQDPFTSQDLIKALIKYFPGALAVVDNEGNLPIHIAAMCLTGQLGVDVVYLLLDEAERQVADPMGIRFRNRITMEESDEASSAPSMSSALPAVDDDEEIHSTMVRNNTQATPLIAAIQARVGWEMVEALALGLGGIEAATDGSNNADGNNALHLLCGSEFMDPEGALVILKVFPILATQRNAEGILPIELACLHMFPPDVVFEMVLADLPFDIDRKHEIVPRNNHGASWWYLVCDCDDTYVNVVEQVLSFCTLTQIRALSALAKSNGEKLLDRATPLCQHVLQSSVRFIGRYEFDKENPVYSDPGRGLTIYDGLDYGDSEEAYPDGIPVVLRCYESQVVFEKDTAVIDDELDFNLVEELFAFSVGGDYWDGSLDDSKDFFFLATEQPDITLERVVRGMLQSSECQSDENVRRRYTGKVFALLRIVAKALHHLHSAGIVHGKLDLETCCKYADTWKVADILRAQVAGDVLRIARISSCSPPECFERVDDTSSMVSFRTDVECSSALDAWAFGKLAFYVLVGEDIVESDSTVNFEEDQHALRGLLEWDHSSIEFVRSRLLETGVSESGVSLLTQCLDPSPEKRPAFSDVLRHSCWQGILSSKQKQ